jgi:hypothetical protein
MTTLNFDSERVIKAWNMNQEITICRNGKIYKMEFTERCEYGNLNIILRSIEDLKKGIKYKIHFTEIAETLNKIFENLAINEIK